MRTPDSVRDHVVVLLLAMVLLVTFVAGVGAVGVASLTDDVDVLVDDLRPAAYANIGLRNDMGRAQAAARGWSLSGEPRFLEEYRRAVVDSQGRLMDLAELAEDEEDLAEPLERQSLAARQWISYADGLVRREPGPVPAPYLLEGQSAFDSFVVRNDAVSESVNAGIEARGAEAGRRARWVIAFVVLLSFLGLGATALIGRSLVRRVSEPLEEVERAVECLATGDLTARVSTDGPRETRGVARALNTLAEENQRAREMEEQVVAQLRRLDRAKDEFVSTVSHELRTPLTSIAGYVELFEDGFVEDLTPQQRGMLAVVRRNVDRLRSLIEDLLTLSRVESDAFRTSFDLVDLGAVTCDVARDIVEIAERSGVLVSGTRPEHPVLVRGDAGQLARAVLNLLTNAVKFSPPGSRVELGLVEREGLAEVSVVDQGIGIPAEELATLGTRFFRASNAVGAEITGTGLGLRIVQTIADNHGGVLRLESAQGEGTTARLLVPLARDPDRGNIAVAEVIKEG
jgi:two-component system, OmpR family, sensor kinase